MNHPDCERLEAMVREYSLFRLLCHLSESCRERAERETDAHESKKWSEAAEAVEYCATTIYV